MTKKLLKIRLSAIYLIAIIIGVVAVVGGVVAYTSQTTNPPTTVIENAGDITINNPVSSPIEQVEQEHLGALPGPNIEYDYLCVNGDCTYYLSMPFFDASTTIAVFEDPFLTATSSYTAGTPVLLWEVTDAKGYVGATSTIEMAQVVITGPSTSTFDMSCTLATSRYMATTTPVLIDLEDSKIVTSTIGIIRSGMTSSTNPGYGSLVTEDRQIANETRYSVMFTPAKPYFVCSVWPIEGGDLGGILGGANTFDGVASIRVSRPRY